MPTISDISGPYRFFFYTILFFPSSWRAFLITFLELRRLRV